MTRQDKSRLPERIRRWSRVVLILVLAWALVAWIAAKGLIVKVELAHADAIAVLAGSSTYVERADWAARLYHEGRAPIVILSNDRLLSGWSEAEERNPFFYELTAAELRRHGVPPEKILVIPEIGPGTYRECLSIRDFAASRQFKRLLIVTSAYHTRRALWSMQHAAAGNLQIGIDGPPPGWQTPAPAGWWLSRWGWKVVAAEYAKMVYYRLKY